MKIYVPVFRLEHRFNDPQRYGIQEINTDRAIYCRDPMTDKITSISYRGAVYSAEYIFSSEKGARLLGESSFYRPYYV